MPDATRTIDDATLLDAGGPCLDELLPALRCLDRLLKRAVAMAQDSYGPGAAADPFQGLHIGPGEAERLLTCEPGAPTLWTDGEPLEGQLGWLQRLFDLSHFDLDLVLIALAPEIDLRYERLYAYLQDDVTRRRPTVDLALNLLCPSAQARLARRAHLAPDAPLIQHDLMRLVPDPNQVQPPLLAHYLRLDDRVVQTLLGQRGLDARLAAFCQLVDPAGSLEDLPLEAGTVRALAGLVGQARETGEPLTLYFHGPQGAGKRCAAEAVAHEIGASLLTADGALLADSSPHTWGLGGQGSGGCEGCGALEAGSGFEHTLTLLFREARFHKAVLYLQGMDALHGPERAVHRLQLLTALSLHRGITILAGTRPWEQAAVPSRRNETASVIPVAFAMPGFVQRLECWRSSLAAVETTLGERDLEILAGRFRLSPDQIASAAAAAQSQAVWDSAAKATDELSTRRKTQVTTEDLFATARLQSGKELASLARKITPHYGWDDIVLPADRLQQLREVCNYVKYRSLVYEEWGFNLKLSLGKGLNVLFAGPSGTGKTMAAEIIAGDLGLDLYKIDLSTVVSKYIGETEKHLARIFEGAESSNAILLFDEADALFGKRSEVRDSHDRYANLEISYLLQRMEEYDGVVILTTNLRKNMDEAFVRRLHFIVEFTFPGESDRLRIWKAIWPGATPLDADADLAQMASRFEVAGGNIRNIALAAAFLAATDGGTVRLAHLLRATGREYQKMGKVVAEGEFGDHRALLHTRREEAQNA